MPLAEKRKKRISVMDRGSTVAMATNEKNNKMSGWMEARIKG
jgi:hypothetical protein